MNKHRKKGNFAIIKDIPEEAYINITPTMKIERVVDKLHTYQKIGIQVIYIDGCIRRLEECREFIALLSKEVSIFLKNPENCPNSVRKYIENA